MPTLVLDGHPNAHSLSAALAARYAEGNADATLVALRDLDFDPILRWGLTREQPLEPDLLTLRQQIEEADRLVVVTPTWWASVPPLLKGALDRVFMPGWAYRYRPLPAGLRGGLPEGLLKGRRARVLITSDTPHFLLPFTGDHAARTLKNEVLKFCGFDRVRVNRFGGVRWSTPAQRERWLDRAARLGQRDARQTSVV